MKMDVCDTEVSDLPLSSDICLDLPLFPVGLSISDSISLKHISVVEKPTQLPVVVIPNKVEVFNEALNDEKDEKSSEQPSDTLKKANCYDASLIKVISPREDNDASLIKVISPREKTSKQSSPRNCNQPSPRERSLVVESRTRNKQVTRTPSPRQMRVQVRRKSKEDRLLKSPQEHTHVSPLGSRQGNITPVSTDSESPSSIPNGITIISEEQDDSSIQNDTKSAVDKSKSTTIGKTTNAADGTNCDIPNEMRNDSIDIQCELDKTSNWSVDTSTQSKATGHKLTKYRSVNELREAHDRMNEFLNKINGKLKNMKEHKVILSSLSSQMKESSKAAFELKRNNQGVPYVNAVKELVKRIHEKFNNDTNKNHMSKITADEIPFVLHINSTFKMFGKVCERIILTTVNYNVTYLEDFHLMAGKIHGMIECIIKLYYDDAIDENCSDEKYDEPTINTDSNNAESGVRFDPLCASLLDLLSRVENKEASVKNGQDGRDTQKLLEKMSTVLSRSNESLANITRLSLGNPKNQSLCDAFASVANILKESDDLMKKLVEKNSPCTDMLKEAMMKAVHVADGTKPGEKQVEELKYALGVCDGNLLIITKHISSL